MRIQAEQRIKAPAEHIYGYIADYHDKRLSLPGADVQVGKPADAEALRIGQPVSV